MKLLNGAELAEFIKERQAKQVRALRQAHGIAPKLAVVLTGESVAADRNFKLKQSYGADILIDVDVHSVDQTQAAEIIRQLNSDPAVHGIIVQPPAAEIINTVAAEKDVEGLSQHAVLEASAPLAIDWLLAGYNVDLRGKHIVIVEQNELAGELLAKRWQTSGFDAVVIESRAENLAAVIKEADVLICASVTEGLISKETVKPNAVIVDRGVGPLTVCALFENVIRAARATIKV